jgi:hypothetical protein
MKRRDAGAYAIDLTRKRRDAGRYAIAPTLKRHGAEWYEIGLSAIAVMSALPPLGPWLMQSMLTHMLVQIPLIFFVAAGLAYRHAVDRPAILRWNAEGAPGLLSATFCLAYWMTPIALDHAAADPAWEAAKIASLAAGGWIAGISWQQASNVAKIFYLGNMVWMSITAGMLYQESDQRLCNAYLWDDQEVTGRALVLVSIVFAIGWLMVKSLRHRPPH